MHYRSTSARDTAAGALSSPDVARAREVFRQMRVGSGRSTLFGERLPHLNRSFRGLGALSPASEQDLNAVMQQLDVLEEQLWDAEAEARQFGAEIDVKAIEDAHLNLVSDLVDLQATIPTLDESQVPDWQARAESAKAALRSLISRAKSVTTSHETMKVSGGLILGLVAATAAAVGAVFLLSKRVRL